MIYWQHVPVSPGAWPGYETHVGIRNGEAVAEMRIYGDTVGHRGRQEIWRGVTKIATFHGVGRVTAACLEELLFPTGEARSRQEIYRDGVHVASFHGKFRVTAACLEELLSPTDE